MKQQKNKSCESGTERPVTDKYNEIISPYKPAKLPTQRSVSDKCNEVISPYKPAKLPKLRK